ncbi:phosphatidylinositol kinase [Paenibacillus sp. 19GGS1-52]|uniref:phosphatidylinositol kinase n=1 Tax=Paenibacillus sp. 19GGS1-52 TaxID=2758563 RepID=UPI001EFC0B16|nr:phosphatidylinositol kinase [Paenibacillus sp. 19GGS1-52]ULO05484.1 phosphatidylinositol kinase [Paenibacillus sp. 19GGS1-52]
MDTNYQQVSWSCMNKYVGIMTTDGQAHDGFIAHVDQDYVTLAIPTNEMMGHMNGMPAQNSSYRQFGFHPGFFPRRRFIQRRIPFGGIAALFLLPFFI